MVHVIIPSAYPKIHCVTLSVARPFADHPDRLTYCPQIDIYFVDPAKRL